MTSFRPRRRILEIAAFFAMTVACACQALLDVDGTSDHESSDAATPDSSTPDASDASAADVTVDTSADAPASDASLDTLDTLDGGADAFCHGQTVCFTFDEPGLSIGPQVAFDDAGVDGSRCIVATTDNGPAFFLKKDGLPYANHTHLALECKVRLDDLAETVDGAAYGAWAEVCTVTSTLTGLVATIIADRASSTVGAPFRLRAVVFDPSGTLCASDPLQGPDPWTRAAIDLDWSNADASVKLELGSSKKSCSVPATKLAQPTTTTIGIETTQWAAPGPPYFQVGLDDFAVDLR